ncbi:cell growth-regulating nucleolar protein-like [Haliotis rubra]|uniref:cell growth-regulating nucleolar protein-like n=1 Tax=Haliotis rubra TaxID=36100 RepID=UPI001EE5243B|nr:cell growth-regulating nucleolar protein-like [Haliotis rubra]
MVFFSCNVCNEALKKNQVEKHCMTKCRNCQSVCCIDCGQDFWGNDFEKHTKCISEDQKYSGKGYVAKVNKGEAKQDRWIEQVQSAIDDQRGGNPRLRGTLESIKNYPNIPRKKNKFEEKRTGRWSQADEDEEPTEGAIESQERRKSGSVRKSRLRVRGKKRKRMEEDEVEEAPYEPEEREEETEKN